MSSSTSIENVLLVSVNIFGLDEIDANEFALLADSAGANIVQHVHLQRNKAEAKYLIGSGKVAELAELVQQLNIQVVIFDQSLTPAQERNLEREIQCRVMDRTALILDIFAQRARTHEGKIQVELAQLEYIASRLVRGYSNLSSQKGGIGLKGPGETQLETDRRLLRIRVNQLKAKLAKIQQTRQQGRVSRQKATIPTVALVGYTNAGKSTLFNRLTNSQVYSADQLFATLDPTVRRVTWQGVGTLVLADTVGFVRHLHHGLIEAFKATLEETKEADILLHIIDSHHPEKFEQIDAVEQVLREIGVADIPIIRVYNKIDLSQESAQLVYRNPQQVDRVYLSAYTGEGIDYLQQAVERTLYGQVQTWTLRLQPIHAKLRHQCYQLNVVRNEEYQDDGSNVLIIEMVASKLQQMIQQLHFSLDDILGEQVNLLGLPQERY